MWATEELGRGEWMTNGDVEKLRKMYECDGRKFILFSTRGGQFSTETLINLNAFFCWCEID